MPPEPLAGLRRSPFWMGAIALTVAVGVLGRSPPATAGVFTDADARVFTLLPYQGGELGRVRSLPDGGVLFVSDLDPGSRAAGPLWRLGADGRVRELRWAGRIAGLAVDRVGRAVVIREGRSTVERLDLRHRRRTVIGDLGRGAKPQRNEGAAIVALDDGAVLVALRRRLLRISDGRVRRLRAPGSVTALAALGRGAFAALVGEDLFRITRAGARRRLARNVTGALAGFGDGRLVTLVREGGTSTLAIIGPDGAMTRLPWGAPAVAPTLDGGTIAQTPWAEPTSMAVASDGSLVMALVDGRVRALVPADSRRARVGLRAPQRLLTAGVVDYVAGTAGRLRLQLRRGNATVATVEADVAPGSGELRLPFVPALDLYEVSLSFTGGRTRLDTVAPIGTRTTLTDEEIAAELTDSEGDEFGREGTVPGPCLRPSPAAAECLVHWRSTGNDGTGDGFVIQERPLARASVTVDPQGEIHSRFEYLVPEPAGPRLTHVIAPQRLATAVRTRVVSSLVAVATVKVLIRRADERGRFALAPATTRLAAGAAWDAAIPLTARQQSTVRRWLARGRAVIARVQVTLVSDVGVGDATVVQSRGVPLTR